MIDRRTVHRSCGSLIAGMLLGALATSSALAQDGQADGGMAAPAASLAARFPAGAIRSEETAEQALAAAQKERAGIEARYAAEQRACYERFFVTSCIDASKEKHRSALEQVRPVEVEAEKFKRQLRVIERDKALAEKRAQEEAEAPERAQRQRDSERAAAEKAEERARQAAEEPVREQERAANTAKAAKRAAEHQEQLQRAAAEEAANAQKRAENTAAYERKVREAKQHQQEVEANRKAKELERQNKATP